MPYITKYKLRHTLYRIEGRILDDPIRRLLRDRLFFLSKSNREYVGVFLLFIKDPIKFIKSHYIEWKDSFTFIIEKNPAYHHSLSCEMLHSAFDNIYIPQKIKLLNLSNELRTFSKNNEKLFTNNRQEFISLCISHFKSANFNLNLSSSDFIPIARPNSGISDFHNATINEILEAIRSLLTEINNFLAIEENSIVARNLIDKLYLKDKSDIPRPLGLPIEIVKDSLSKLDYFNREFINAVSEYFLALFNPENEYDATILKILNFKTCGSCYSNIDITNIFDNALVKSYEEKIFQARDEQDFKEIESLLTF